MGEITMKEFDAVLVEAEENLLIDIQFLLQSELHDSGISRAELAKKLGISKARLSQIFAAEANPTVKTCARLFHGLGKKLKVSVDGSQSLLGSAEVCEPTLREWNVDVTPTTASKRKGASDDQVVALLKEAIVSNDNYRNQVENWDHVESWNEEVPAGLEAA